MDYVVSSFDDGNNWYRKYKSGWIEQGGFIPYRTAGWITVTLKLPFNSVYYSLCGGSHEPDRSYSSNPMKVSFKGKSTTSFQTCSSDDDTLNASAWTWEARGF